MELGTRGQPLVGIGQCAGGVLLVEARTVAEPSARVSFSGPRAQLWPPNPNYLQMICSPWVFSQDGRSYHHERISSRSPTECLWRCAVGNALHSRRYGMDGRFKKKKKKLEGVQRHPMVDLTFRAEPIKGYSSCCYFRSATPARRFLCPNAVVIIHAERTPHLFVTRTSRASCGSRP